MAGGLLDKPIHLQMHAFIVAPALLQAGYQPEMCRVQICNFDSWCKRAFLVWLASTAWRMQPVVAGQCIAHLSSYERVCSLIQSIR